MPHKSRIGCYVIDCPTSDLTEAHAFWCAALGLEGKIDDDGKYAVLTTPDKEPRILLQAVDHPARIHLDIETDDKAAEVARLKALGARPVAELPRWTVLEAPTGHRFCVVDPLRSDFAEAAPERG